MVSLLAGENVVAFPDLAPQEREALERSDKGLDLSHHPYSGSGLCVAATVWVVLLDGTDMFYTGPNIEVRPRDGACAEDAAIIVTFAAGHAAYARAIFAISRNEDGTSTSEVPFPCPKSCGFIAELAKKAGLGNGFPVILSTTNFERIVATTLGVLLPHGEHFP